MEDRQAEWWVTEDVHIGEHHVENCCILEQDSMEPNKDLQEVSECDILCKSVIQLASSKGYQFCFNPRKHLGQECRRRICNGDMSEWCAKEEKNCWHLPR